MTLTVFWCERAGFELGTDVYSLSDEDVMLIWIRVLHLIIKKNFYLTKKSINVNIKLKIILMLCIKEIFYNFE